MRDWLYKDIEVTMWESRPKFEKVKEEGSEVAVDRVVLNPDSQIPEIETINHGVLKLNLLNWLKRSPLNPKYSTANKKDKLAAAEPVENFILHKFHYFYPEEWLNVPEFAFENKNDVIKRKDKELLIQHLEKKEERERERALRAAEEAAAAAGTGNSALAGKKGDPKKDAKGAAKPGKGAAPVDDKNAPQSI